MIREYIKEHPGCSKYDVAKGVYNTPYGFLDWERQMIVNSRMQEMQIAAEEEEV